MSKPVLRKGKTLKNMLGLGKQRKGGGMNFKNSEELEKDYNEIVKKIKDISSPTVIDMIANKDIKYFIEYNELDYKLFKYAIKYKRDTIL